MPKASKSSGMAACMSWMLSLTSGSCRYATMAM